MIKRRNLFLLNIDDIVIRKVLNERTNNGNNCISNGVDVVPNGNTNPKKEERCSDSNLERISKNISVDSEDHQVDCRNKVRINTPRITLYEKHGMVDFHANPCLKILED